MVQKIDCNSPMAITKQKKLSNLYVCTYVVEKKPVIPVCSRKLKKLLSPNALERNMFLTSELSSEHHILHVDLRETLIIHYHSSSIWQKINEFRKKRAGSFQSLKIYACPKSSMINYCTKHKSMYQKGRKIPFTPTK